MLLFVDISGSKSVDGMPRCYRNKPIHLKSLQVFADLSSRLIYILLLFNVSVIDGDTGTDVKTAEACWCGGMLMMFWGMLT
mmetsp:Transcript_8396/g.13719  ORF Transcript_8396/g.13719 Transcript_8396/m.13719 type:complete len:81 (+) Transcript_8396:287-529(+)